MSFFEVLRTKEVAERMTSNVGDGCKRGTQLVILSGSLVKKDRRKG